MPPNGASRRQAEGAVGVVDLHAAAVARGVERCARAVGERGDSLERVHLGGELREHCRLIAGAGADVEHLLAAAQL